MQINELAFDQGVIWQNAKGDLIPARIIDLIPGHGEVQIRVLHQGGAQSLRVKVETIVSADTSERREKARAFVRQERKSWEKWADKRYEYEP